MASTRKYESADLRGRVRDFLLPRIPPDARLCLGYSGGLDSAVLLRVLADLRQAIPFQLSAVHVHHGLSANADAWAAFCQRSCARLGVPIAVERVAVERGGTGVEAAARAARYRVFAAQPADFLVLAHQQDDQAETFLLRLLRGSGARGLAAMAKQRGMVAPTIRLLRPLLDQPRQLLEAFAAQHDVAHIDDESNQDLSLDRNWLRHRVLPLLGEHYPACRPVLARNAALFEESAGLLDDLARLDLAKLGDGHGLRLAALRSLGDARARNLLRYWLTDATGLVLSHARLRDMLAQLLGAPTDRQPSWQLGDWLLHRYGGYARLLPGGEALPGEGWVWQGEAALPLAGRGELWFARATGRGVRAEVLTAGQVQVTWRRGGEKFQPHCRRPRRPLKDLLREAGLSPPLRQRLPLVYAGDRLVWVAGVGIDCACQAGREEPGWVIDWQPAGSEGRRSPFA